MFNWVYRFPTVPMALLFTVGFALFAIGGALVFRRRALPWVHKGKAANDYVGIAVSSFAVLYGILLGLLAVASFQNFANMQDLETKEAASLIEAYRACGGLPEPARTELQNDLRTYTRETINVDWPLQQRGVEPTHSNQLFGQFFDRLMAFSPTNLRESNVQAAAMRLAADLSGLRRQRLASVNVGLPNIMWVVVVAGLLIFVLLYWMFDLATPAHLLVTGLTSAFLGLTIFLIIGMDYPYRGEISIDSQPFEQVYNAVMK